MFACIYSLPSDWTRRAPEAPRATPVASPDASGGGDQESAATPLTAVAEQFSPRYEQHRDDLVSIDLSGLQRLFGDARTIGEELRRTARTYQLHVNVAIAGTRAAAMLLVHARPGLTVIEDGGEAAALAPLPISILERLADRSEDRCHNDDIAPGVAPVFRPASAVCSVLKTWGLRTLGEVAALPAAELSTRLGQEALAWQALARGEDARPIVPTLPDERFESTLELEWPIEGLEPLSFVLTRLLEPLIIRLERRDRGAAAIVTMLRLVSREACTRRLELPTPLRDVRALRTLVLLDLDAHPPGAAIDAVTVTIEPTPGRIVQHTLFTRPTPTPEQLSTLIARLTALMGEERVGAPAIVDTHRPGAFAIKPFAVDHDQRRDRRDDRSRAHRASTEQRHQISTASATSRLRSTDDASSFGAEAAAFDVDRVNGVLRRCRQQVPARVIVEDGRPVRLMTDRRGYAGGCIVRATGPWRVSGDWWAGPQAAFSRDEWELQLADGIVYRVFRDAFSERWFIDAVYD